jgi:hypothetical protein
VLVAEGLAVRDGEARVLYRKLQETAGPDYPEDLRQHLLHLRHVHEAHKGHGEVEAGVLEGKLRGACPPVPDVRGLAGLLFLRAVDVVLGDDYPDKSFRNPEWPGWSFIRIWEQPAIQAGERLDQTLPRSVVRPPRHYSLGTRSHRET